MSPTPDQINTALIGVASLGVAGISFVYASKAQHATREAEAARSRIAEVTVDAAAYARARDLYESGIKTLAEQNDSLRALVAELRAENARCARRITEFDRRITILEQALRAAGAAIPEWDEGGNPPP